MDTKYALALAGGGTRGAYQVGAYKAIRELNLEISAVSGTSIGAINGALIVQDDFDLMTRVYDDISPEQIIETDAGIDFNRDVFHITNIFKMSGEFLKLGGYLNTPLRKVIESNIDIDKIYSSPVDYGLVTFEIGALHPVEKFRDVINKENLIDYILASACFPIFKAQRIGQKKYTDGGIGDNLPINMLVKKGYKNVIAVDLHGIGARPVVSEDDIYIKTIRPTVSLGGLFEFNKEKMSYNRVMGYMDTLKAFNKLQGNMYFFTPDEYRKILDLFNVNTVSGLEYAASCYNLEKYEIYSADDFFVKLYNKYQESIKSSENVKINLLNIKELVSEIDKLKLLYNKQMILNKIISQAKISPLHLAGIENTLAPEHVSAARAIIELEHYLNK